MWVQRVRCSAARLAGGRAGERPLFPAPLFAFLLLHLLPRPPGELRSEHCCPPTWEGGRYEGVLVLGVVVLGEQGKNWAGEPP